MEQHHYKQLHNCRLGYVAKCESCDQVQFMIGNIFSWMSLRDFKSFLKALNRIDLHDKSLWSDFGGTSKIMIKTPVDNMMLTFSTEEFSEFLDMLNMARLVMDGESLVKN